MLSKTEVKKDTTLMEKKISPFVSKSFPSLYRVRDSSILDIDLGCSKYYE